MAMKMDVTIYITTKNRADLLERALISILEQDYTGKMQVIIVDDGSDENCKEKNKEIVKKIEDKIPIVFIVNEISKGACYARNLAINRADGKFITGLDDDDEFLKSRISSFINEWDDNLSFLCSDFINIYKDKTTKQFGNLDSKILSYKSLLFANFSSNQIFTKTEYLKKIGGFDENVMRLQDWDTWLRLSYKYGHFKRLPASYIMHHEHEGDRVSRNISYLQAYKSFVNRNIKLYSLGELLRARLLIFLLSFPKFSFLSNIISCDLKTLFLMTIKFLLNKV
ncbi:TPA: glycosyltransferase [Escherichia coli]|nr:glycosyl transferase family 2 [Escherichia coli]HCY2360593.1 glycosyltransferase [Escherichia coli]